MNHRWIAPSRRGSSVIHAGQGKIVDIILYSRYTKRALFLQLENRKSRTKISLIIHPWPKINRQLAYRFNFEHVWLQEE